MKLPRREYHECEALLIKYYRLLSGMSQGELAKKCHCKKSYVSACEAGKNITRDTRIAFAKALGREPGQLAEVTLDWKEKLLPLVQQLDEQFKAERAAAKRKRKSRKRRPRKLKDNFEGM